MIRQKSGKLTAAWQRRTKGTGSTYASDLLDAAYGAVGNDDSRFVRDLTDDEIVELAGRLQERAQELLAEADDLQTYVIYRSEVS